MSLGSADSEKVLQRAQDFFAAAGSGSVQQGIAADHQFSAPSAAVMYASHSAAGCTLCGIMAGEGVRPMNDLMRLRLSYCCRALKSSQGQLAVQCYSKALDLEHFPSIPFAAVLYANRAAAEQSLGQHAKAIADCLRAIALKPDYAKVTKKLSLSHTLAVCHAHTLMIPCPLWALGQLPSSHWGSMLMS